MPDFIERRISEQLMHALGAFPCVAITGPRQVGKTTLTRKLLPDYNYVTLDRPLYAEQAEQDPEGFLASHRAPLVIDEVQYAPTLFRHLKVRIDEARASKGQYVLTGSQKFTLMQGVSESLAGRVAMLEMEGLSTQELQAAGLVTSDLHTYHRLLLRGGFPELWIEPNRSTQLFFDAYIATYLERDVRQILAVGSLRDYERFIRALALRTGQPLNKATLAKEVGVSATTIGQWLSVMEALGHIVLLEPWFANLKKRLVKAPKVYLADAGLACALMGIDENNLATSPIIGALWETFVFSELRKQTDFSSTRKNLWYYRDQSQHEVDFIYERGHELTCIECKWTSSPNRDMVTQLNKVQTIFETATQPYRITKTLISRAPEHLSIKDVNYCSPLSGLLAR